MHDKKSGMCKSPLKVRSRPFDFNWGEKFIDRVSESKVKLTFKKLPLEFGCSTCNYMKRCFLLLL